MIARGCVANALECQQMACSTRDANERRIWLETAIGWVRFAEHLEQQTCNELHTDVATAYSYGKEAARGFGRGRRCFVPRDQVMVEERRRSRRYPLGRLAAIMIGNVEEHSCLVKDYSDGGVRLQANGFDVPDNFSLIFAPNEPARSGRYQVVWRLGKDIGAKLIDTSMSLGKPSVPRQ
jgi:hypothetical protein